MYKKIILVTLLNFLFLWSVEGQQNYIYHNNKKYISTPTWTFGINGTSWGSGNLEVSIGKNTTGGYLMLQTEVPFENNYIGGTVYIFLSDGSTITCGDKGIRDFVDNKSVVLYVFSEDEMTRLKTFYISKIRFTIKPVDGGFNGTKTCDNKTFVYGTGKDHVETDIEISKLYE
jgi:hypothetical protein